MSVSLRELRVFLPKVFNGNYSKLPKLHAELRERRPRIRATSVYNPRRVRFNHDDADLLLKPHAMTIATYPKRGPTTDIYVKTREEILEEEAAAFAQLKISKMRRRRPRTRRMIDEEDLNNAILELSFTPLDFKNIH